MKRLRGLALALGVAMVLVAALVGTGWARPATAPQTALPAGLRGLAAWQERCQGPQFLWKVTRPGRPGAVWLLGSVHFASPSSYPLCPVVERAFARADELMVELDIDRRQNEAARLLTAHGYYPEGQPGLSRVLTPRHRELLARLGVRAEALERFRPWYVALLLQAQRLDRLGYKADWGVDAALLARAHARGMAIVELETVPEQFALLESLAALDEQDFLTQSLEELDHMDELAREVYDAWSRGDAAGVERVLFAPLREDPSQAPAFDMLYFDRNTRMAAAVEQRLARSGSALCVVGAGHLVGDKGVPALLRRDGCEVAQQ
ncbi:MAG: TraB/GumN family protein [Desulfovibrionaceae bacterium]